MRRGIGLYTEVVDYSTTLQWSTTEGPLCSRTFTSPSTLTKAERSRH